MSDQPLFVEDFPANRFRLPVEDVSRRTNGGFGLRSFDVFATYDPMAHPFTLADGASLRATGGGRMSAMFAGKAQGEGPVSAKRAHAPLATTT